MIFISKGYFLSKNVRACCTLSLQLRASPAASPFHAPRRRASSSHPSLLRASLRLQCLREARYALAKEKRLALAHDPVRGGASVDYIKEEECPAEMLSGVFTKKKVLMERGLSRREQISTSTKESPSSVTIEESASEQVVPRDVIEWHRIKDFQLVSLKLLAEQLLLGCPNYDDLTSLKVYVPGELTSWKWVFHKQVTLYASANNPGAEKAALALRDGLCDVNSANTACVRSEVSDRMVVPLAPPGCLAEAGRALFGWAWASSGACRASWRAGWRTVLRGVSHRRRRAPPPRIG